MKTTFKFIMLAAIATTTAACGNHNKQKNYIEVKDSVKKPSAPQKMQEYKSVKTINWRGETYTYNIHRMVDTNLPIITDENGNKFYDNKIDLTITRNGSPFFSQTFTKNTFAPYLDESFKKRGTLEGLVFDKTDNECMHFAASVCFPQTDEYIPLVVKLSSDGSISIARDTKIDTGSDADSADEQ
jgi:hypothetical protein